jgi:hypothetical protein
VLVPFKWNLISLSLCSDGLSLKKKTIAICITFSPSFVFSFEMPSSFLPLTDNKGLRHTSTNMTKPGASGILINVTHTEGEVEWTGNAYSTFQLLYVFYCFEEVSKRPNCCSLTLSNTVAQTLSRPSPFSLSSTMPQQQHSTIQRNQQVKGAKKWTSPKMSPQPIELVRSSPEKTSRNVVNIPSANSSRKHGV